MFSLFLILLLIVSIGAFSTKRYTLASILLIGFLQDPVRKLLPGQPVIMVVMVGVVFACAMLKIVLDKNQHIFEPYFRWTQSFSGPLNLYLLLIFLQTVHSYLRYGNLMLTGIGLIFYLAPLCAIIVGYFIINNLQDVRRFMGIYAGAGIILAGTIFLSFWGVEHKILEEVGIGLVIYDQGTILKAHSGLMRSSEIAAWHIGASACFIIILLLSRGSFRFLVMAAAVIMIMMAAIALTGRRKMIMQILVFSSMYFIVFQYYQKKLALNVLIILTSSVVLIWFVIELFFPGGYGETFGLYFRRGSSVFSDASERFFSLGFQPIQWAINRFGFWGGGIGIGAQGAQHFGGALAGGAAEGGLGKITAELGVPALFIITWLAITVGQHINRCLHLVFEMMRHEMMTIMGVAAFLTANIPTFIVATQVFGDVFVLLILGLLAGFIFALPKVISDSLKTENQ